MSTTLLTLQPHARRLQVATSWQTSPEEARVIAVDTAGVAALEPERASVSRCTVLRRRPVTVAIKGRELHAVVVVERIAARVSRPPRHVQLVAGRLWPNSERTVLGVVPVSRVAT